MPLSTTDWTILLALGVVLAGAGWEYRRRQIFSDRGHWSHSAAYSVMVIGRLLTLLAVLLFVGGESVVEGGLRF